MRSRIIGGIALLLGLLMLVAVLRDSKPLEWKPFLGGVLFIGMGGYYLFTGRRAASMKEFVVEGKLSHDDSPSPKVEQVDEPGHPIDALPPTTVRSMSAKSILWILALTFVIDGAIVPFVPEARASRQTLVHGLVIAFLCYFWCRADAESRSTVAPGNSALWAGLFPVVGLPAYFFRTRPPGRAIVGTLKAIGLFCGLLLIDLAVAGVVRAVRT